VQVPDTTLAGAPHKDLWLRLLALRWPLALVSAAILPFALPLPGNPITIAGFVAFIGGAVLVSSVRWLIVFLPVFAALGPYFLETHVAGINLFGLRLLTIILIVFSTPFTSRSEWWFNPVARYTMLILTFWIVYGTLSLLWTPDQTGGLVEIVMLVFGAGLVLVLFNLKCYTQANLDMLRFGWVFALVLVLAQATYEVLTGNHLPSFTTQPWDTYLEDGTVVQSTLGHPTGFGGYLLLTTPFLLWSIERARGAERVLCIGMLAATAFFSLFSGSRISFIGLVLQFALYFLVLERRWYVTIGTAVCGTVAVALWASVFMHSDFRLAQKYQSASEKGLEEGSIGQRIALTVNGIWMAIETGGRGVGADGYQEVIESGDVLIPLRVQQRSIQKPVHNVWVEIMSEYGLASFVGLMALLGWFAWLGWRAHRKRSARNGSPEASVGRAILVGLVGYAFFGVGSGNVLPLPETWMFLGSLSVAAAFLYDAERPRQPAGAAVGVPQINLARQRRTPASRPG
jgi:teichuronic acid biosynthesis protein TuaE